MPIDIMTASAGSGKTTELVRRITDALTSRSARARAIVATTFSRRAADGLREASSQALLAAGFADDAQALRQSWVGTIHSVCDRLIRQYAFELGISPDPRVIPEGRSTTLLATALADVVQEEPYATHVRDAAYRFGFEVSRREWLQHVEQIVEAARQNALAPSQLAACAEKSLEGMLALLDAEGVCDDARLDVEIREAIVYLRPFHGRQKNTTAAIQLLDDAAHRILQGRLRWPDRVALAQIDAGRDHRERLFGVREEAGRYMSHPMLRTDVERYVRAVFHFAERGLSEYDAYKLGRRFIDFADQEMLTLALLSNEACAQRLKEQIDLVLVDEFQDVSPLQLAIFIRLSELAPHSVWVGDVKQSIYGFRGADPSLLNGCVEALAANHGVLRYSYRSRPALVRLVSTLFERTFGPRVALDPRRDDKLEFGTTTPPPPLSLWLLDGSNKCEDKAAIATGIAAMLSDSKVLVIDRTGVARQVRAGDVAVLCRQNDDVDEMAAALSALGVPLSVGGRGLFKTREGHLAECALRYLLDPGDGLAAATIAHTFVGDSDQWLKQCLACETHPRVQAIDRIRPSTAVASPLEALQLALDAVEAHGLCRRWPGAGQRLANLQAVRTLAEEYEESCRSMSVPATGVGMLLYFRQLADNGLDYQAQVEDAVQVMTCHASKGLEWPVVVLADLDRKRNSDPFDLDVMSGEAFDPHDPLIGRWIRLWLSPFGQRTKDVPFIERARTSPTGRDWAARDAEQEARLLYVAMTRARDHLVLAARQTSSGPAAGCLDSILTLPWPLEDVCEIGGVEASVRRFSPSSSAPPVADDVWFARPSPEIVERPLARLAARDFPLPNEDRRRLAPVGAIEFADVDERLARTEQPELLGRAVHAFLAADPLDPSDRGVRIALAARALAAFQQQGAVAADALVSASDRLQRFLSERYPGATWYREIDLALRLGDQQIHGVADLLLECPRGWVVIDHKTYTGPALTWRKQAQTHLPQIEAYARAVTIATGAPVIGRWLHFPLAGGMLQIVAD